MRRTTYTSAFEKDVKLARKRHYDIDKLKDVIRLLSDGDLLDPKYKDHPLSGDKETFRECHIKPDWLLIYRALPDEIILTRTGTHSDLFK